MILMTLVMITIFYALVGAIIYGYLEWKFLFEYGKNFKDYAEMMREEEGWEESNCTKGQSEAEEWVMFWPFLGCILLWKGFWRWCVINPWKWVKTGLFIEV